MVADAWVPSDSPWFAGHFPGEPILPGVAQLGMVFDLIAQFSKGPIEIQGIERVRYKKMIRPGDLLRVVAEPRKGRDNSYSFRISLRQELVCSGFMVVKPAAQ